MSFSAIILAAGKGKRFGYKKQNLLLGKKPLWKFIKDRIKSEFDEVIVVGIDCKGGKRRRDSVFNGLIISKGKYVVIFDSARPLVTLEQVKKIKKAVLKHKSVSFAYKPADTWYRDWEWIRDDYMALQVPQAFQTKYLIQAHIRVYDEVNDDCSLMYRNFGIKPHLIKGGYNLTKITYPEDYNLIKAIWKKS